MYRFNENSFVKKKISVSLLLWIIIIFILFSLNQWARTVQLKSEIKNIRKEHKNDIQEKIKTRELLIEKLRKDNDFKRQQIESMNDKIDSLNKVKSKIKIKYIDKYKEIKGMDAEQIKNYWNNEFN
jgi:predicted nuclease with TOPRIM domain